MLEKLGEALRKARDKIANALFLDKNVVESVVRELQRALIEADVNILLVKEISDKIKKSAFDERIKDIEKKEHIIKLLHDELVKILGEYKPLELKKEQNRIMLLGLYGAGKTTTIAKLGNWYAKRGKKVALVGLDVHRPAAKEQLQQLGEKNNLNTFIDFDETNALKTYKKFKKELEKYDLVLIDTAGRHTLDKELIKEIKELNSEIKPTETILIMPSDIGQSAKKQASEFQDALKISGVIITRMDSTAKGGGALTACAETKAGVYFITNGEKINDIEEFNPESFLSRLLGMGDLQALIEKIRSVTDDKQQEKMQKKLEQGKLSLEDVIEQVKSMNQIGGFDKIKNMIPGLGKAKIPENMLENQQTKIAKWEHILKSMTKEERENPDLFEKQTSRISRVATGAGVNNSDIRALLKQYKMLQDLVKGGMGDMNNMDMSGGFSQKQMQKMMKKFGKKKMMRFK
jgi:signal recognition particle subunit SRP54